MNPELYLFIIWKKSINKKDLILEDIEKNFVIRDVYEIKWSEKEFRSNLKRFYGSALQNATQKAELCGIGPFLLILVSDSFPDVKKIALDDVNEVEVNVNIYDNKMKYREWIGMDFALHGSISEKETKHDLMLLLGKNIQDLEKELPERWNGSIKKIESEIIGYNGWENTKQFLDMLNMTTNYVILRNFEDLPDKFLHHDIDILTDDVKNMSHIINEDEHSTEKASIKIGDKKILIDFRYHMGHHYDEKWAKDVLKRRILHKGVFYVPSKEDHFYTLLHHATRQKHVREEYKKPLSQLATELNINENIDIILTDFSKAKKFLEIYMIKMGYHKITIQHRILYKISHSESGRLVKVAIFLLKTYGMKFLLKKIKEKIIIIRNSK
jgi:hypothetical protein